MTNVRYLTSHWTLSTSNVCRLSSGSIFFINLLIHRCCLWAKKQQILNISLFVNLEPGVISWNDVMVRVYLVKHNIYISHENQTYITREVSIITNIQLGLFFLRYWLFTLCLLKMPSESDFQKCLKYWHLYTFVFLIIKYT